MIIIDQKILFFSTLTAIINFKIIFYFSLNFGPEDSFLHSIPIYLYLSREHAEKKNKYTILMVNDI